MITTPHQLTNPAKMALIDQEIFHQLLSLDDDDDKSFSSDLMAKYIDQAETTLNQLSEKMHAKDWDSYSKLGHFLKGSSAQLGLLRVQEICKEIQHIRENQPRDADLTSLAQDLLDKAKSAYHETKLYLIDFFRLEL